MHVTRLHIWNAIIVEGIAALMLRAGIGSNGRAYVTEPARRLCPGWRSRPIDMARRR